MNNLPRLQLIRSYMSAGQWEKARALLRHLIESMEVEDYIHKKPMRASWLYNDFGLDPLGGITHKESPSIRVTKAKFYCGHWEGK